MNACVEWSQSLQPCSKLMAADCLLVSLQGSTSCIWQPESFWDMRAAPPEDVLPLFAIKPAEGHAHNLYSAVAGMAVGPAGAAAAEAAATEQRQHLARALYCLQRSAGAVVAARLGPDAPLKVPPDWSPLALLGGLCKLMAGEHGRPPLSASRVMAVPRDHRGGLAASAVFGRLSPQQEALGQSMMWPGGGGDGGW